MNRADVKIDTDVLIVGGGLAGCHAAIQAKRVWPEGKITLVDKSRIGHSGQSSFAAGIFTTFMPGYDHLDDWVDEMITWGEYLNDQEWVMKLYRDTWQSVLDMEQWAREQKEPPIFERDENSPWPEKLLRRKSRAHHKTYNCVINSLPMMRSLRKKAAKEGVDLIDRLMVTDLVFDGDGEVAGIFGLNYEEYKFYLIRAKAIVLAASGAGFKSVFMGHKNLTGELQRAAYESGIVFRNMEQYSSNTTSRHHDIHGLNLFVSVGGKFLNNQGEEFMWQYHPLLGSRARLQDLVQSFCREVAEGRGPIHLDMSAASESDRRLCRKILPETFRLWDRAGVDPFEQLVEWIPTNYGTIITGGGIHINTRCETNMAGVFAAGDITPIPPHGTYSFGGVNLAFTVVSGREAGNNAAELARTTGELRTVSKATEDRLVDESMAPVKRATGLFPYEKVLWAMQETIIPYERGYIKSEGTLTEALRQIEQVENEMVPGVRATTAHELMLALELRSMAPLARLMVKSSLARLESRGFHCRVEHPRTDNVNWLKWVMVQKQGGNDVIWPRQVETPYRHPKEEYSRPPGVRVQDYEAKYGVKV